MKKKILKLFLPYLLMVKKVISKMWSIKKVNLLFYSPSEGKWYCEFREESNGHGYTCYGYVNAPEGIDPQKPVMAYKRFMGGSGHWDMAYTPI